MCEWARPAPKLAPTPHVRQGRFLCGIAMMAGLIVISMALSLVGSNFADAWEVPP